MDVEFALLQAIHEDPWDKGPWLVLADWFEDEGQYERAELVRLQLQLRGALPEEDRERTEIRIWELLGQGVRPCTPLLTNSIGTPFALILPGTFWMGSLSEESNRYADEDPRHQVEITKPFYLGIYQVTQEEYERVIGKNPSHFSAKGAWHRVEEVDTRRFPVENVSWNDAAAFCTALSKLPEEQQAGRQYRLPSEAEWEYACRAGASLTAPFHVGWTLSASQANFDGNYPCGGSKGVYLERPAVVGSYPPNAFGLYDMHGNVWEWCQDWFGAGYYNRSPERDPRGPVDGSTRIQRGGSWYSYGWACRSGQRSRSEPTDRNYRSGLRLAMSWERRREG